jgi:hypothetical protein
MPHETPAALADGDKAPPVPRKGLKPWLDLHRDRLTLAAGVVIVGLSGRPPAFGLLTGGTAAICGTSAAQAIAAVLPRRITCPKRSVFSHHARTPCMVKTTQHGHDTLQVEGTDAS